MDMPTVSIIVTSLGEVESNFRKAIESLLNQTGVRVHLIISTVEGDPCVNWLNYPGDIQVVKMRKEDHPGRGPEGSFAQLQLAVPRIKGDYTFFFSSNDIAFPDKSINEITAMGKGAVCYSSFYTCNENGQNRQLRTFPEKYSFQRHLEGNFVYDSSMVRSAIFQKYMPFSKLYNCGYWDLWLRIYKGEGNVFAYNSIPTKNYIQRSSSMHTQRQGDIQKKKRHEKDRDIMLASHRK